MRKGQTLNKQHHKIEVGLGNKTRDLLLGRAILRTLRVNVADIGIMGLGFWLGYVQNYRPGIPGTPFVFPDFAANITQIKKDLASFEALLKQRQITVSTCEERIAKAVEQGLDPKSVEAVREDCARLDRSLDPLREKIKVFRRSLVRQRFAQGALMSLLSIILTRNLGGILQAVSPL